jgi:hypothetical protein
MTGDIFFGCLLTRKAMRNSCLESNDYIYRRARRRTADLNIKPLAEDGESVNKKTQARPEQILVVRSRKKQEGLLYEPGNDC